MDLQNIERSINSLYDKFLDVIGVDKQTNLLGGRKFSGAPYIGTLYPQAKKRILFVGLDIGNDEGIGVDDFEGKRGRISPTHKKWSELPPKKAFDPHFSGTYALTLRLLYKYYGWETVWKKFTGELYTCCPSKLILLKNQNPIGNP